MKERKTVAPVMLTAFTLLAPALTYLAFCAPGLTWLDSGELIAAAHSLGTSHPPGQPLWTIVARAIAPLLAGNVAFRYNLVSVIFAVLTLWAARSAIVEIIRWSLPTGTKEDSDGEAMTGISASSGVLILAFTPAFAEQALRAEVYSLGFLLVTLLLWCCVRAFTSPVGERGRMLVPIALMSGLGMTVHNLTIVLLSPVVAASVMAAIRDRDQSQSPSTVKRLGLASGAGVLGLLPYIYVPLRSARGPYMDLSHVDGIFGLLHVFSGMAYSGSFAQSKPPVDIVANLGAFWQVAGGRLHPVVLLLAVVGIVVTVKKSRWFGLVAIAAILLPLAGILGQREIYPQNPDHGAYIYPSFLLATAMASIAMRWVTVLDLARMARFWSAAVARGLATALALLLVVSQIAFSFGRLDMRYSTAAHSHASLLDAVLPTDAIVFLNNDEVAFPLLYMQVVEQRRMDVTPVISLQVTDVAGYVTARKWWPARFPSPDAMVTTPSVTGGKSIVIDGIVNHASGSHPVLWDWLDGSTLDPARLTPFYHLARVLPVEGRIPLTDSERTSEAEILSRGFSAFFVTARLPVADTFAHSRLAAVPLGSTGKLHHLLGNYEAAIVANTIGLGFSPEQSWLMYNRAVALEAAGRTVDARADYDNALQMGFDEALVREALERIETTTKEEQ